MYCRSPESVQGGRAATAKNPGPGAHEGKGRVFYTAYGHDERTFGNPAFVDLIERGTLATRKTPPPPSIIRNGRPSKDVNPSNTSPPMASVYDHPAEAAKRRRRRMEQMQAPRSRRIDEAHATAEASKPNSSSRAAGDQAADHGLDSAAALGR